MYQDIRYQKDNIKFLLKIYENKELNRDIVIQTTLPLDFHEEKNEIERRVIYD